MRARLYVVGALGGLAALAVAVVVVLAFGRHDPSPPSLEDEPNPAIPGEILYLDRDGCFVRVAASGASRQRLACAVPGFGTDSLYWLDDTTAGVVRYSPSGPTLHKVDLKTGVVEQTGTPIRVDQKPPPFGPYSGAFAPDGTFAAFDEDGKLFVQQGGARVEVADFDTPEYNQPQVVLWSPDSQWMLVTYYGPHDDGPELWVISRDGATQGTLAKDLSYGNAVAWRIEGAGVQPALP